MLSKINMIHNIKYLRDYLINENITSIEEYEYLTEAQQESVIAELVKNILETISNKLKDYDTTLIDKSRGDIKRFEALPEIQNAIKELQYFYNSNIDPSLQMCKNVLNDIIQAIMNLNKYVNIFKEAYRAKKTIVMVEYQALIGSIISTISYLISESIDFTNLPKISLKDRIQIVEINQIKNIKIFNQICKSGEINNIADSVSFIRENYSEFEAKELNIIYEAYDIGGLINNGFNTIIKTLTNNSSLNGILLKAASILAFLVSAKEMIYALVNSKSTISNSIENIIRFVNHNDLKPTQMQQMKVYNKKNIVDTVVGSNLANNTIAQDNTNINAILAKSDANISKKDDNDSEFNLDVFNF